MGYKYVVSDLDNTLLPLDEDYLPEVCIKAINALKEKGISFIPNSGRILHQLPKNINEISFDYAIMANGSTIYDYKNKKIIKRYNINREYIKPIGEIIEEFDNMFFAFVDDIVYADSKYKGIVIDYDDDPDNVVRGSVVVDDLK